MRRSIRINMNLQCFNINENTGRNAIKNVERAAFQFLLEGPDHNKPLNFLRCVQYPIFTELLRDQVDIFDSTWKLNQDIKGGAWCPRSQITTESTEWLEIDLHSVHVITGTGTQGRFGNGQGQEFAKAYVIEYWRPKLGKWVRYRTGDGQEFEVTTGLFNHYHSAARRRRTAHPHD
ncbi:unnamed protein product [Spodoptera exigua]|nr:unnamed protein product [Spodoptera exigua]